MPILPVALCPRVLEPLTIDGRLEEGVWAIPPAIPFFVRPRVRWIPEAQTQVFTAYDDTALNFGFRCFEDAVQRLERGAGPPEAGSLYHDDLVGIRLRAEGAQSAARERHFVFTAAGKVFEERADSPGRFVAHDDIPCAASVGEDEWTTEGRLAFDAIGFGRPEEGDRWGFTAYRLRVGSRLERSGWLEVGPGPFREALPGWLIFESPDETEGRRARAVEPYLRQFGALLTVRVQQAREAEAKLKPEQCPVTRYRVNLMIRSLQSIKNDTPHSYHPDALRHYAQALQFNLGRLDELIECLRQGEDPLTSADGYVFLGSRLPTDGSNHAYAVLLAREYDWTSPHPVIVLLHGLSDDWIADSRAFIPLAWPIGLDFVMAVPSGLGLSRSYRLAGEDEVFAVLDQLRTHYSVDPKRIFLIGVGEGAAAAQRLAIRYPHVFSACAAAGFLPASVAESESPLFHWSGGPKGWVNLAETRGETRQEGQAWPPPPISQSNVTSIFSPGFLKTLMARKPGVDRQITIEAATSRHGRGPWAQIDRPRDYSRVSRLTLQAHDDGRVEARGENVAGFTLRPAAGPFVQGQSIRVEVDGKPVAEAVAGREPLIVNVDPPPTGARVKRPGLSGPIDEAFHGPLIYVYGTDGDEASVALMRQAAYQACRWPFHDLRIPVKADTEISEEEMKGATLHFFGGAQNRLCALMAGELPVQMGRDSFSIGRKTFSDPGEVCQFVYPNILAPERLMVAHLANSPGGWLYRGWFPPMEQPEPMPDLWIARIDENPEITRRGVGPRYQMRLWFDGQWRLP